jgi:hypothetical protein
MSWTCTSCSALASFFTSSMVPLQVEQPALKISIVCFTFPPSDVFVRVLRKTGWARREFDDASRPRIPDGGSQQYTDTCVHGCDGVELKLSQENQDGAYRTGPRWSVPVTLTRSKRQSACGHRKQASGQWQQIRRPNQKAQAEGRHNAGIRGPACGADQLRHQ